MWWASFYLEPAGNERRIGVLHQVDGEVVEPLARFRCGNVSHWAPAVFVKASRRLVAGTIRLSSRLHPDDSINVGVVEDGLVRCRASAIASIADIAPLTPLSPDSSPTGTSLVNDEVGGVTSLFEVRSQGVHVVPLVPGVVPLGKVLADGGDVLVVVGGVGGETTDFGVLVGLLSAGEDLSKDLGGGCKVVVPTQPATVGSVEVEGDVGPGKLGDGLL